MVSMIMDLECIPDDSSIPSVVEGKRAPFRERNECACQNRL